MGPNFYSSGRGPAKKETVALVGALIEHAGGLDAVVAKFKEGGLSHVVESWISNEENLSITKEQLENVLGVDMINRIAEQTGMEASTFASRIAQTLPQVVDRLTPEGRLPTASGLVSILGSLFNKGGTTIN